MAAKLVKSKFDINFADDKGLAERVAGEYSSRVRTVRNNRLVAEETWWRFFNMWNVTKDGYHGYIGRAQLYIPEVRKNVEAQARQLTKSAFPSDDCFDVSRGLTGTRRGAQAWKSYHSWAMDNADIKRKYMVAMRQECLYGTSPIYLPWRKVEREQYRSKRNPGNKKIVHGKSKIELFNGPDFMPRDIFRWYVFNPKANDLDDGCFEIMPVSPFQLEAMERKGLLANLKDIKDAPSNAYLQEEMARDVLRAEAEGIQIQYNEAYAGEAVIKKDGDPDDKDASNSTFMRTRIFADMVFPEACEDDEDPNVPIPMMVDMYNNNICGLIQRNPFFHQQPPYVVGKYIQPNPDEYYGQGIPWAIQFMQYELNAKAEQGLDSATLSLNPIAIIDPGLAGGGQEFDVEPGAKWFANPQGVHFANFTDVTPISNAAIMQLKGLMADYSDRSPALPPQLLGKSRTATQSEMVFDSLGVDNWLFQEQNESLILTPMLQQWEAITDQNMDDDMLISILGRRAGDLERTLLSREDLLGRYAYKWKGASVTAGKQTVARQMLDALKVVGSLPPGSLPKFNYSAFLETLWIDFWDIPNPENILGTPEERVSQDAAAENKMVTLGYEIEVEPTDDDQAHMKIHDQAIEKGSKQEKEILMAHILEHKKADEAKKAAAAQQQQMQQMQMQQQMAMAQAGVKQGGAGHGAKSRNAGNRTQMSPNASTGNMASGNRG